MFSAGAIPSRWRPSKPYSKSPLPFRAHSASVSSLHLISSLYHLIHSSVHPRLLIISVPTITFLQLTAAWCQEPAAAVRRYSWPASEHGHYDSALTFTSSRQVTDIQYKHTIALQKSLSLYVIYFVCLSSHPDEAYQVLSASIRCTPQCRLGLYIHVMFLLFHLQFT